MNAQIEGSRSTPLDRLFDRIVIINLAHRRDRYDDMLRELQAVGIAPVSSAVTRFEAVRPAAPGPFPNIGTHGCFMSHLGVLEDALASGLQSVLILEDDCSFVQGFNDKMAQIAERLTSSEWGLFHGGDNPGDEPSSHGLRVWEPTEHLQLAHFLGVRGRALQLLPAYLRRMLDRPAGDPLGGPMHVDGAYSWFRESQPDLPCYVAKPRVAYQRSSKTDIHDLSWSDRVPLVSGAISLARRMKNRVHRAH